MLEYLSVFSIFAFGFLLGLEHSTDADHIAAISALSSEAKNNIEIIFYGIYWALGHSLTIAIVSFAAFFLSANLLEESTSKIFEFFVGLLLLFLGTKILVDLAKKHFYKKQPKGNEMLEKPEKQLFSSKKKSFYIGVLHGLAGSAAIAIIFSTVIKDFLSYITYILFFSIGTITGMLLFSGLFSLVFRLLSKEDKYVAFRNILFLLIAIFNIFLGLNIVLQIFPLQAFVKQ